MREKTLKKKSILGIIIMIVVIAVLGVIYALNAAKPVAGSKLISIEVVNKEKESVIYELQTDAEYFRQAMEEVNGLSFTGEESVYGIMVNTINGETADYSVDGAYWSFYVNDEYCNYGIDSQPVHDGDKFRIEYTVSATE